MQGQHRRPRNGRLAESCARLQDPALSALAESARSDAEVLPEERREMALARAADLQCNVGQRKLAAREQPHGAPDAAADDVLVRRHAGGELEAAAEAEGIDADRG